MIELTRIEESEDFFKLYWSNGKYLGDIVMDVDGYYVWWPDKSLYGSWDAYGLRAIAERLDEMNKDWDEKIRLYFEGEN